MCERFFIFVWFESFENFSFTGHCSQFIENVHLVNVNFGGGRQQDASEFCLGLLDHFAETVPNVVAPIWRDHFESVVRQTLLCQR